MSKNHNICNGVTITGSAKAVTITITGQALEYLEGLADVLTRFEGETVDAAGVAALHLCDGDWWRGLGEKDTDDATRSDLASLVADYHDGDRDLVGMLRAAGYHVAGWNR